MSQAKHSPHTLIVRGFGLLAGLVLTWCAAGAPARASACFFAVNTLTTYYSTAAHTKIVGTCVTGLCGRTGCTGMKTNFFTVRNSVPCEVCIH